MSLTPPGVAGAGAGGAGGPSGSGVEKGGPSVADSEDM